MNVFQYQIVSKAYRSKITLCIYKHISYYYKESNTVLATLKIFIVFQRIGFRITMVYF